MKAEKGWGLERRKAGEEGGAPAASLFQARDKENENQGPCVLAK